MVANGDRLIQRLYGACFKAVAIKVEDKSDIEINIKAVFKNTVAIFTAYRRSYFSY